MSYIAAVSEGTIWGIGVDVDAARADAAEWMDANLDPDWDPESTQGEQALRHVEITEAEYRDLEVRGFVGTDPAHLAITNRAPVYVDYDDGTGYPAANPYRAEEMDVRPIVEGSDSYYDPGVECEVCQHYARRDDDAEVATHEAWTEEPFGSPGSRWVRLCPHCLEAARSYDPDEEV